jgi:hypothetical protein
VEKPKSFRLTFLSTAHVLRFVLSLTGPTVTSLVAFVLALALFAIGRSIGRIGHALEQYATNHLIRPRAKYVGFAPAP